MGLRNEAAPHLQTHLAHLVTVTNGSNLRQPNGM